MAETKYDKYIKSGLTVDIPHYTGYSLLSHQGELDADCSIGYHCISKPMSFDKPHSHEFTELLCFIGGDPTNILDLGAEVEVCLGEEGEKHYLNTAGVVSIPAGLVHCPINIKNVKKPIVFLEISLTRIYGHGVARDDAV
jgi:hypothetical protein